MFKMVSWSYPTSDNAKKCGKYNTGCFTISITNDLNKPAKLKNNIGYDNKEEAFREANEMEGNWHPLHYRYDAETLSKLQ